MKKILILIFFGYFYFIIVQAETKNICKALDFKKWNNCYGKTNLAYDYKMGWGGKNPSNIEGIYEGFWINGQPHGKGELLINDNDFYVGNFEFGKQNGYVEAFYNDGRIFRGEWKNGLKEGLGTLIYPNGEKIEGLFKENKLIKKNN